MISLFDNISDLQYQEPKKAITIAAIRYDSPETVETPFDIPECPFFKAQLVDPATEHEHNSGPVSPDWLDV